MTPEMIVEWPLLLILVLLQAAELCFTAVLVLNILKNSCWDLLFTYSTVVLQYQYVLLCTVVQALFGGSARLFADLVGISRTPRPDHLVTRDVMMYCRANAKKCRALVAPASTYSSVRRLERPWRIRDPLPPWLVRGGRAPEAPAEGPTLEARCRRPVFTRFGFTIR